MAATATAVLESINGTSWANAFQQVGGPAQNLDILQIVSPNGESVLLNVDYAGTVHNPASGATGNNTRKGQYRANISSGTTAQLFASAFTNPSNLDILQIISPTGGSVVNYIDYAGVSH
jgi:hypothetical protein